MMFNHDQKPLVCLNKLALKQRYELLERQLKEVQEEILQRQRDPESDDSEMWGFFAWDDATNQNVVVMEPSYAEACVAYLAYNHPRLEEYKEPMRSEMRADAGYRVMKMYR